MEKISEGIERAEPRAELLSEVVNILEGEVDALKAVWDVGGSLKAVKTSPTVALPRDPEELRARLSLMGRAWAFVAMAQPNCMFLQGNTLRFGSSISTTFWVGIATACTPEMPMATSPPHLHGTLSSPTNYKRGARWLPY